MCTYLNKTGATYYFRRPVPDDLAGYFTTKTGKSRTEWKFSLGTKDRETAKRLLRPHEIETDRLIDEARAALAQCPSAAPLGATTGRDEVALREREEAEAIAAVEAHRQARYDARREHRVAIRQRMRLSTVELTPEEAAWRDLVREAGQPLEALQEAAVGQRAANAVLEAERGLRPYVGLRDLFNRYEASKAANPKTVRKWRSQIESLIEHLGHDDVSRVTRASLNSWTAALIAKGLQKKTVVDGYLSAVRVVLSIAHDDGTIPANPAAGLKVRGPKAVRLRERDHTDEEAETILRASLIPQSPRLAEEHARARRWVPWLCAYTGARVGEMTQLRAMDIAQEGDIWYVLITPEAGPVKTNEARRVPLHRHLIEQGFTDLAKAGDATPLFYREGAGNEVNPASKVRAADLAKWVRTLGVETPQPNHGWRHRFKTMCRVAEMPDYIIDKLQGHAPANQGGKYGTVPLETLRNAVERLPRYEL